MRFLLDEDVPRKLLTTLLRAGHDAIRVEPSTPDAAIADRARREGRILVTLDKDFTNTALYAPAHVTIVHIHIHPPHAVDIVEAFTRLLDRLPPTDFRGLIVLGQTGSMHRLD